MINEANSQTLNAQDKANSYYEAETKILDEEKTDFETLTSLQARGHENGTDAGVHLVDEESMKMGL